MPEDSTVEQLQQGIPLRGIGAPSRAKTHYARILALLRERGPVGVLGSELYNSPQLYGRSPRNRISELRKDGHLISGESRGSDWFYVLVRENESPTPRRSRPGKAEQLSLPATPEMKETMARVDRDDFYETRGSDSPDWYTRETGKTRPSVDQETLFRWERRQ
jgi:hypothetical protein